MEREERWRGGQMPWVDMVQVSGVVCILVPHKVAYLLAYLPA